MLILLSPSLGRDTPSMRSLYQQWQTGILGMTAKRLVSVCRYYSNNDRLTASFFQINFYHVVMASWILLRLVDGAKCTRVWHWWRSEVRGTRFPSTARGKAWSSSSTSCAMKPCPSLYIAFRRFRIWYLAWYFSNPMFWNLSLFSFLFLVFFTTQVPFIPQP